MGSKEKYYQHIVKNLIYKTIVTENGALGMQESPYVVKFPWEFYNIGTDKVSIDFILGEINNSLFDYIEENYGASSDDTLAIVVLYAQTLSKSFE